MTAPPPPDRDELVSAYLDGVAAPDEIAVIEADPILLARVDELRAVSDRLGRPTTPDPAQREAHLQAALGAFDSLVADGAFSEATPVTDLAARRAARTSADPATADRSFADTATAESPARSAAVDEEPGPAVTSLDRARERRRPRGFNLVAAAAAVVALLFVGAVAVGLNRGESRDVVADAATEVSDASAADAAMESSAADAMADDSEPFDEDEAFAASDDAAGDASSAMASRSADAADATEAVEAETAMADDSMDGAAMDDAALDEAAMDDDAAIEPEAMADESEAALSAPVPDDTDAPVADAEADLADGAAGSGPAPLVLGPFADLDELDPAIRAFVAPELPETLALKSAELLPPSTCADKLIELGNVEAGAPSMIGLAELDGALVELHAGPGASILVVAVGDCAITGVLVG